ncbi:MAG: hypothetical protein AAF989_04010 [Planctomycetota bacterium]
MPRFYILLHESSDATEFDLDRWAGDSRLHTMTLSNDGTAWQLRNENDMELGTVFQRATGIYISWQYLSFGPRFCWLAQELVGDLLSRGCKVTVGPCSAERFNEAQTTLSKH